MIGVEYGKAGVYRYMERISGKVKAGCAYRISDVLHCADDDYRFDFLPDGMLWKLAFVECITLPVYDLNTFPYTEFALLDKKELHIRREKALACVSDGKGEYICARSWVPFYSDGLSYIAYSA